jgi:hypothetical protein
MMAVTALALIPLRARLRVAPSTGSRRDGSRGRRSDVWPAHPGNFRAAVESFPKQEGSHARGQITAIAAPASSQPPPGRTRHAERRLRLAGTTPAVQADGDATEER